MDEGSDHAKTSTDDEAPHTGREIQIDVEVNVDHSTTEGSATLGRNASVSSKPDVIHEGEGDSVVFDGLESRGDLLELSRRLSEMQEDNIKVMLMRGSTCLQMENGQSARAHDTLVTLGNVGNDKDEHSLTYAPWIINPHFASFTKPYTWWMDAAVLVLMGCLIGLMNLGYTYAIVTVPNAFLTAQQNAGYATDPATVQFAAGQVWYIGIGAATGLVNGVLKALLNLGDHPGFMAALQMQTNDPLESFKVVICTLVCLMGGSSVGPEAGLASLGGGVGAFLFNRVLRFRNDETRRRKKYILSGMAAAFTAFLPTPVLACLLTWELGVPPAFWGVNQVDALTTFIVASVPASAVYFALEKSTIYDPIKLTIPLAEKYEATKYDFALGFLYGIMGALLAIVYYCIRHIVRVVLLYPKKWAGRMFGQKIGIVIISIFGGVCYGALGYVFPLTMGDGASQIQGIINNYNVIGPSILAVSCFAKILSFWICMETGFVGGIFTPMLAMGNMMGAVFACLTPINGTVAIACSFIALAAAVIPAPLLLIFFSSSLFQLGSKGLIPITTCAFTSHLLIDGIGLLPVLSQGWFGRERTPKKKS